MDQKLDRDLILMLQGSGPCDLFDDLPAHHVNQLPAVIFVDVVPEDLFQRLELLDSVHVQLLRAELKLGGSLSIQFYFQGGIMRMSNVLELLYLFK